jgi:UDP-GlcNAc:undecaprenyl-phosphate/decaprenyl-phosphate GlcNAc-1-phosphate transferase
MIYFFLIFINCIFLLFFNSIERQINIYDHPNEKKIHSQKISLLGGIIFILNISIYLLYSSFYSSLENIFGFSSNISNIIFILSIFFLFFVGLIDDKKDLSARIRILFLVLVISINLFVNPEINISIIKLSFSDSFSINNYSYFWTLLCFLLFINAFNFFDGINLQISGFMFAICTFFLIKNTFVDFILVILISNFFFFYLNYKSKIFLGNNGSFFLPFIFGTLFISGYNNNSNITSDEIVILMLIPGMDLLRLFFQRILSGSNPLKGDREHIHHYLLKKYSLINTVLINQFLIWIPFLFFQFSGYFYLVIIMQVTSYIFIIKKYKN